MDNSNYFINHSVIWDFYQKPQQRQVNKAYAKFLLFSSPEL